ncbi:MAG: TM2 domain-containing protein [Oscillospiraceae bacterium]|nr:TM2 domain-containing protein [Oscillospiraceae bacterium]
MSTSYNNYTEKEGGVDGKYNWTAFLLCLFLGFTGIHRFYGKRYVTGVIWLFSFGIMGLGWAWDFWCHLRNRVGIFRSAAMAFSKTSYDSCCIICENYPFECGICGHKLGEYE